MSFQVNFSGNIVDEVELRFTPKGTPVCRFTVAVNHRERNANGDWVDGESHFIRCTTWERLAENVAGTLEKGKRVMVSGGMRARTYETRQGEKRTVVEVTAPDVGPSLMWQTAELHGNRRKADEDDDLADD